MDESTKLMDSIQIVNDKIPVENDKQSNTNKKIVAYFDFDGTITTRDTLLPFLVYTVGYIKFILRLPLILPVILLYLTKVITNEIAKEKVLTILLKGKKENSIEKKAKGFASCSIDKYIKPEIFAKLEYHQEHNHTIILVSANLGIYLRYWAIRHRIDGVIATELDFYDGRFTGKLATRNCYGEEKVKRLVKYLDGNQNFSYSYGYGNSRGDYELLNFVNEAYFINGGEIEPWKNNAR